MNLSVSLIKGNSSTLMVYCKDNDNCHTCYPLNKLVLRLIDITVSFFDFFLALEGINIK